MGHTKSLTSPIALAALGAIGARAASAPYCVAADSNVCFSWGVPQAAIQSGSGNIYFQIRAPTTYEWVALGIGTQMNGADIFVMYTDGTGNVTLSTRPGAPHIMPQYKAKSDVELLDGSGVIGGDMIANVRCGDCKDATLTGSSGWISAWKTGNAINSQDKAVTIDQHDDHSIFKIILNNASVDSDSNPFTRESGTNTTTSSPGNGNSSGDSSNIVSGGSSSGDIVSNAVRYGHGVIMTLVWVVLYPVGAMLMPAMGKWAVHASFQVTAFLAMWAGLGLGYVMAHRLGIFWHNSHTKCGTIICALMAIQPVLGAIHHLRFKRQRRRGVFSHLHVWYGRILILVSIINGGLGLRLAGAKGSFRIAYIVLAIIIAGPYFLSIPWLEWRKFRVSKNSTTQSKIEVAVPDENGGRG